MICNIFIAFMLILVCFRYIIAMYRLQNELTAINYRELYAITKKNKRDEGDANLRNIN